ncbi:ABC transporter permease [Octadecabacter sp. CECT 8868]|uniref:ABC transporter permease n=1 Tax=Octadecabacter algicola TaxID=2909342 RepID=UPI001F2A891A|nr:ABC transporter permease [Octadecabacter algicola]MCF2904064.1 ABC transporter permease [Octadecabacter algicola]
MEPLSWTGSFGSTLIPALTIAVFVFLAGVVVQTIMSFFAPEVKLQANADGTIKSRGGLLGRLEKLNLQIFMLIVFIIAAIIVVSWFMPYGKAGILGEVIKRFLPVWLSLIVTFAVSITFKRKLGLYGKLFDSMIGMIGFGLVMFWVFTSIYVGLFDMIATHDPLQQISGIKNKTPGFPVPEGQDEGFFPHYLLGGDNLARDIFSRMVHGSVIVMVIAPLATVFAFMVGITLGLPAGYYGGKLDTLLSFLANLILAFPVILLFYLLVTPEIVATGLPNYMAAFLFIFPLVFFGVMINSRFKTQPSKNTLLLAVVLIPLGLLYLNVVSDADSPLQIWPAALDFINIPSGILVVFVSVVFVNSPTVFRIVRGLALDIKTRDYVAAAQTRGEGPWYIMLWEILPNARGPLIVDFCLRIGYTTILLGTLGFFGLGLPPESPDWGSTINEGRKLLLIFAHPALPPAIALLSLVLGLNLLADGLREESLKD